MSQLESALTFRADPVESRTDLVQLLFLFSVFLAPLEYILSWHNFTTYDAAVASLGFLIVARRQRLQFLPFNFAIAIFLLSALFSTIRAIEPFESLAEILQFAFIFFVQIPVILTLGKSQGIAHRSLFFWLGGTLIVLTWAFLSGKVSGSGRALAFYSANANQLGYAAAYTVPFVLYLVLSTRRRRWLAILLALPALYIMLWAVAASGSRSAAVATVGAALVFLAFRRGFYIRPQVILRFLFATVIIGLFGYCCYLSNYLPAMLHSRIERTLTPGDQLSQDRVNLNVAGWRAFVESPLIGVGPENFRYVAPQHYYLATPQDPHNLWIGLLSQFGLFGTLAFLALIGGWFFVLFREQRATEDRSQRELLWAFTGSMISVMMIHMFAPMMLHRQYWLIYGLGLAACGKKTAKQ